MKKTCAILKNKYQKNKITMTNEINKINEDNTRIYEIGGDNYVKVFIPLHQGLSYPALLKLIDTHVGDIKGKSILDVGCRNGEFLDLLAEKGALTTGIDLTEDSIETACKNGHTAHVGSMHDMSMIESNQFDVVVSNFTINYLPKDGQKQTFQEIYRVLKPNGVLIFNVMHPYFIPKVERESYFDRQTCFPNDNFLGGGRLVLYVYGWTETAQMLRGAGYANAWPSDDLDVFENLPKVLPKIPEGPFKEYVKTFDKNPYALFVVAKK